MKGFFFLALPFSSTQMSSVKEGWFYSKRVTVLPESCYCIFKIVIFLKCAEGIMLSSEKTKPKPTKPPTRLQVR